MGSARLNQSQFEFRRRPLNFGRRDVSSRQNVGKTTKKQYSRFSSFFSPRVNARLVNWNPDKTTLTRSKDGPCTPPRWVARRASTLTFVTSETLDGGPVHLLVSGLITPSIRETGWSSKCPAGLRRSGLPRTPMCSCFGGLARLPRRTVLDSKESPCAAETSRKHDLHKFGPASSMASRHWFLTFPTQNPIF